MEGAAQVEEYGQPLAAGKGKVIDFPQTLQKGHSPADTLILVHETYAYFCLPDCKIINLCVLICGNLLKQQ